MGYFRDNIEKMKGYEPGFQPPADLLRKCEAAGAGLIKLNTNENPYPPSPAVLQAITEIKPEQLRRYPDPLGNAFREAAAKINDVETDWIMCCNGGDELLKMAFTAFCDRKPRRAGVSFPVPTYSLYPVLANIQNCRAVEVPFDEEFNLPAKLARVKSALTIVCNPNAPSGTLISAEELAELADEIKGVLLLDEAYVDFAEKTCVELVRQFENVIILRSLSKGYSLAGLRFGYAIARPEMLDGLLKVKDSYNADAIAIAAATAAICDRDYFKETIDKIKAERARLSEKLRELGFELPDSSSNFVFAEHKSRRAKVIFDKLVERNIYVRYWDLPGIDNKLRISVGTPQQDDTLLSALKEIVSTSL